MGKTVYQIAVCDADPQRLYAGLNEPDGVHTSITGGASWGTSGLGGLVRGLAVSSEDCQTAYAFVWGQGVQKTTNGGTNWQAFGSGLEAYGYAVVLDTRAGLPQTLYVGTYRQGIYKLVNGATTWMATALASKEILGLELDDAGNVYAATFGSGVWRLTASNTVQSLNGGLLASNANVYAVAVSASRQFAATQSGLYKTVLGGTAWTGVNGIPVGERVYSVFVDPEHPSVVYAGVQDSGVYRSTDGGDTFWAFNNNFPTATSARYITINAATPRYLLAGTLSKGIYRIELEGP